ncbi:MAG: GNAT family N-acetyltransferase [Muribaculaceae bacterium]|nr:GNAT family N-acetyltransferase [Muribaculaceae bacterium]
MIKIKEYTGAIDAIMHLLLLGDESAEMIGHYLPVGKIYTGFIHGTAVAVCVAVENTDGTVEIKNLAVAPTMQRQGIGRAMLAYTEAQYPGRNFLLGTGETPSTLRFYHSCGYRLSHRIPNFFIDNYDHPIIEEGIRLCDMLYLVKNQTERNRRD